MHAILKKRYPLVYSLPRPAPIPPPCHLHTTPHWVISIYSGVDKINTPISGVKPWFTVFRQKHWQYQLIEADSAESKPKYTEGWNKKTWCHLREKQESLKLRSLGWSGRAVWIKQYTAELETDQRKSSLCNTLCTRAREGWGGQECSEDRAVGSGAPYG
jgi:hypothetical protein